MATVRKMKKRLTKNNMDEWYQKSVSERSLQPGGWTGRKVWRLGTRMYGGDQNVRWKPNMQKPKIIIQFSVFMNNLN